MCEVGGIGFLHPQLKACRVQSNILHLDGLDYFIWHMVSEDGWHLQLDGIWHMVSTTKSSQMVGICLYAIAGICKCYVLVIVSIHQQLAALYCGRDLN